jgi:hypothetical protein
MSAAESMEQQSMKQQERATILKGVNSHTMSKIEVSKETNGEYNPHYIQILSFTSSKDT